MQCRYRSSRDLLLVVIHEGNDRVPIVRGEALAIVVGIRDHAEARLAEELAIGLVGIVDEDIAGAGVERRAGIIVPGDVGPRLGNGRHRRRVKVGEFGAEVHLLSSLVALLLLDAIKYTVVFALQLLDASQHTVVFRSPGGVVFETEAGVIGLRAHDAVLAVYRSEHLVARCAVGIQLVSHFSGKHLSLLWFRCPILYAVSAYTSILRIEAIFVR